MSSLVPKNGQRTTTLADHDTATTIPKNVPRSPSSSLTEDNVVTAEQPRHEPQQQQQHIVLFYKYHPLSAIESECSIYRDALESLCLSLSIRGRILVGCSKVEGLNGTVAGSYADVLAFTHSLIGNTDTAGEERDLNQQLLQPRQHAAIQAFRTKSRAFFQQIQEPELSMSADDFKWSSTAAPTTTSAVPCPQQQQLFPDLNIKLVPELIGTGRVLSSIPISETAQGYLTPQQWHAELERLYGDDTQTNSTSSLGNNKSTRSKDTVVIDCRNTKEYEIGRFVGATDPQTTTFAQFPQWVQEHGPTLLADKNVLMYCTGGIRCEKASAYIRNTVPSVKTVRHLKGGIHKYLEVYGEDGNGNSSVGSTDHNAAENKKTGGPLWQGKNFVFDGRGAASAEETRQSAKHIPKHQQSINSNLSGETPPPPTAISKTSIVVGRCVSCSAPYDSFDPHCVCTVCREPTLNCQGCQADLELLEYHCKQHAHLKKCYFSDLERFSIADLHSQLELLAGILQPLAVGKRFRQKRKTIQKQMEKVVLRIQELQEQATVNLSTSDELNDLASTSETTDSPQATAAASKPATQKIKCRNCGELDCSGYCWGFFGLQRRDNLLQASQQCMPSSGAARFPTAPTAKASLPLQSKMYSNYVSNKQNHPNQKSKTERSIEERRDMGYNLPPCRYRDTHTGVRVPPCATRMLQCTPKAKWCGHSLIRMVQSEFSELQSLPSLHHVVDHGLLLLNQKVVTRHDLSSTKLKNNDVVARILHWHEAPVLVPDVISVVKVRLPGDVLREYTPEGDHHKNNNCNDDSFVYVCSKPPSVPVHPAGPYLSNTLTVMVEAQEQLSPGSLSPVHRTDRVTGGLTLLCSNNTPAVARAFHKSLTERSVEKLYLAKVKGRFPDSSEAVAAKQVLQGGLHAEKDTATYTWDAKHDVVKVQAPVATVDAANGVRRVDSSGKPSISLFRFLYYNAETDASVVACFPVTGRNHQLRVHLQWLGHSIVNDVLYGGPLEAEAPQQTAQEDIVTCCSTNVALSAVVDAMKQSVTLGNQLCSSSRSITKEQVEAAQQACVCCDTTNDKNGIVKSFTSAQLLQGGHAIRLHAFRYLVKFLKKKKRKQPNKNTTESSTSSSPLMVIGELTLSVDPPDWADQEKVKNLSWLCFD